MYTRVKLRLYVLLIIALVPLVFGARANATGIYPEVIVETNKGSFTLELYKDKAPKTVANFLAYVEEGFYTNMLIHRAVANYVIQGGGFEKGMQAKKPHAPVKNESDNRLRNLRGTIAMARRFHPDTATSQFYINLADNADLNYKSDLMPGYTVFGRVIDGMDVVDAMSKVPTHVVEKYNDVPKDDIIILSAKRKPSKIEKLKDAEFKAGEHYIVLDKPLATRDSKKIEVVELFSYGCPHCYEFEPVVKEWAKQQEGDIDFWFFPAVWNTAMKLYARAFYAAYVLDAVETIHQPLFTEIIAKQKNIATKDDLADFFVSRGVDREKFINAFDSAMVTKQVQEAEQRVRDYKPSGVPELVVNGKYRVDRMHAGGLEEMIAVTNFLIKKEREQLKK
ncbi:Periplasmic thiol:disulfide interchange protein DsbA [hydrothermal vent metagenome]|uniref:Thiol:disulfide interchange protein DsbA n=1 Tax=hydrothermal vent metagenome TaxID=652676 RepID=A0A3B0YF18_9ZZZZ